MLAYHAQISASTAAADAVAFETAIARFTIDPDQLRDPVLPQRRGFCPLRAGAFYFFLFVVLFVLFLDEIWAV